MLFDIFYHFCNSAFPPRLGIVNHQTNSHSRRDQEPLHKSLGCLKSAHRVDLPAAQGVRAEPDHCDGCNP